MKGKIKKSGDLEEDIGKYSEQEQSSFTKDQQQQQFLERSKGKRRFKKKK